MATNVGERARGAAGMGGGWLMAQWKREPIWGTLMAAAAVLVVWQFIGTGGQANILRYINNVGGNPISTFQAIGAAAGVALVALGGLLHFFPPTHDLGDRMIRGVLKGLAVLFLGVPLLAGLVPHLPSLFGQLFAHFGLGA